MNEEKFIKTRQDWDRVFNEIVTEILKESFSIEEIKEIFSIGIEVYKRKRSMQNGTTSRKVAL